MDIIEMLQDQPRSPIVGTGKITGTCGLIRLLGDTHGRISVQHAAWELFDAHVLVKGDDGLIELDKDRARAWVNQLLHDLAEDELVMLPSGTLVTRYHPALGKTTHMYDRLAAFVEQMTAKMMVVNFAPTFA